MRKISIVSWFIIFFLLLILPHLIFADEVSEVWSKLYKQAKTVKQKYDIMLNIVELDNRDMIPTLIEALEELNMQDLYMDKKEKVVQNDLKILVVRELGELRASGASEEIFRVVREAEDSHLKEEALIAMGKTGSKDYALNIALILRNLTFSRGENIVSDEAIANGCIKALERLGEPVGYLPVFYATTAGFSRRVTETAEKALLNIVDDPSDILTALIMTESCFEMKLHGLRAEYKSNASELRKFEVATHALNEGLINKPADLDEEALLREIRRLALEMIIELKDKNNKPIPLIEQVLYRYNDDSEKVYAIEALKSISTNEAVKSLISFLAYQNDRQASGVTAMDNRIIMATIKALGSLESKVGYQELLRVKFSGYPAAVEREADKALKSIDLESIE